MDQPSGLYGLGLQRLSEIEAPNSGIISFPQVFEKLGRSFSLKKPQIWELLILYRDFGFITIVRGHGICLKIKSMQSKDM